MHKAFLVFGDIDTSWNTLAKRERERERERQNKWDEEAASGIVLDSSKECIVEVIDNK